MLKDNLETVGWQEVVFLGIDTHPLAGCVFVLKGILIKGDVNGKISKIQR